MNTLCPACGRAGPPSFPGARVTCACGAELATPRAPEAPESASPYRVADGAGEPTPPEATCPFCGHAIPPLARVCPTCDVRLEGARCRRCFALGAPGAFACARCGEALPRDVLFDALDAPCPRCARPLETARGAAEPVHECPRCGGLFVAHDVLARILTETERGLVAIAEAKPSPRPPSASEAHYVPCPMCHATMNRTALARTGVVVDVCARDGTWFSPGELPRALAVLAARTRAR